MGKDKNQDFHPVRPGCIVGLGDYGYFDNNNCWRRLENICTIPGMFCTPQNQVSDVKYEAFMQHGISLTAGADAAMEVQGAQAGGGINHDSCVFINKLNDGSISPIGFQTVTLSGGKLGFGKRTIKYVGDSSDFQDTYDEDSEPTIY